MTGRAISDEAGPIRNRTFNSNGSGIMLKSLVRKMYVSQWSELSFVYVVLWWSLVHLVDRVCTTRVCPCTQTHYSIPAVSRSRWVSEFCFSKTTTIDQSTRSKRTKQFVFFFSIFDSNVSPWPFRSVSLDQLPTTSTVNARIRQPTAVRLIRSVKSVYEIFINFFVKFLNPFQFVVVQIAWSTIRHSNLNLCICAGHQSVLICLRSFAARYFQPRNFRRKKSCAYKIANYSGKSVSNAVKFNLNLFNLFFSIFLASNSSWSIW